MGRKSLIIILILLLMTSILTIIGNIPTYNENLFMFGVRIVVAIGLFICLLLAILYKEKKDPIDPIVTIRRLYDMVKDIMDNEELYKTSTKDKFDLELEILKHSDYNKFTEKNSHYDEILNDLYEADKEKRKEEIESLFEANKEESIDEDFNFYDPRPNLKAIGIENIEEIINEWKEDYTRIKIFIDGYDHKQIS